MEKHEHVPLHLMSLLPHLYFQAAVCVGKLGLQRHFKMEEVRDLLRIFVFGRHTCMRKFLFLVQNMKKPSKHVFYCFILLLSFVLVWVSCLEYISGGCMFESGQVGVSSPVSRYFHPHHHFSHWLQMTEILWVRP